jgi:uncharacterized protein YaaQ
MKLVIAVVHNRDKNNITDALLAAGFKFTTVASSGGFLREGNTTLLIGSEADEIEAVMDLLRENCHTREQYVNALPPDAAPIGTFLPTAPMKVTVGGAITFVIDVERFERV